MRKSLLIFSFALFALGMNAQQFIKANGANTPAKFDRTVATGFETVRPDIPAAQNVMASIRTEQENIAGTTTYDLQSNNSTRNGIARHTDGSLAAAWTMGNSSGDGYSDRGTGYNTYTNGSWGDQPTARIESERTGWGSVAILADGSQFVVAHTSNNEFITNRNASGAWVEDKIPTAIPVGVLWPRCASGGADGMTVHVIGISTPSGLGGAVWEDLDGHLVYFRSLDGGATWDQQDVKLPGMDSEKYTFTTADSYAVEANGETVAIGLFPSWGDVQVTKSSDNGSSWETSIIKDFPFDPYTIGSDYDTTLIPAADLVDAPQGNAFQTSDGNGDLVVDNSGGVHVFYGEMYYLDEDFTDATWSFYPGWSGLRYWNESHGEDSTRVIAGLLDEDGDGAYGVGANEYGNYGANLTSMATAGVDTDNNIYLMYAGVSEAFPNDNANPGLQYNRHLYTMASTDGGTTWPDVPVDMIREDVVLEVDLLPAIEAVYPSMTHNIGESFVNVMYQEDFEPGQSISGDTDPANTNFIMHLAITKDEYGIEVGTEVVSTQTFDFSIAPNPARGFAQLSYTLQETSKVNVAITNMMGQTVKVVESANHVAGQFNQPIMLDGLARGVYLVQFRANDQIAVQKLVID
ncbi:MAG: hypothetical protein ACJAVF_003671 [Paraglaciecola sp.]|jgi:hypothetical protein